MTWEVVKEIEERVDLQRGPYGFEQVGVKIGERVIWLKVTSWPGYDKDAQYEEWVKIAAMIAAAPAMYEALKRLSPAEGFINDSLPNDETVNLVTTTGALRQLKAAIAKAEGRVR